MGDKLAAAVVAAASLASCEFRHATREPDFAPEPMVEEAGRPSSPAVGVEDPRFAAAVCALSRDVATLPELEDRPGDPAMRAALEHLADAIEAVPAEREVSIELEEFAGRIRNHTVEMALGVREGRPDHLAIAKRAVGEAASALLQVSRRSYASAPEVGGAVLELVRTYQAIDDRALEYARRDQIARALRQAVRVLTAMELAVRTGQANPG